MASDDPAERYGKAVDSLTEAHVDGDISFDDWKRIEQFLDARNENISSVPPPESGTCALRSLESYCRRLTSVAREVELSSLDTDAVNQLIDDLRNGNTDVGPDDGYADGSMQAFCGALSGFYEVHTDLGVDPADIVSVSGSDPAIDSRTVLSRADVEAMRDACTNSRDRALLALLTYTMQRIRAVQTLRVKDVDLQDGVFYLNPSDGGLKGASGKRPLLDAREPVRQWLNDHPTGHPDDYLITVLPSASRGTPGDQLTQQHINRRLKAIAAEAGVEKPANAHAFRHYGVTIAKRIHGMGWDEIAFMGGWSDIETPKKIYEHLSDEDYIEQIETQFGLREPEGESGPVTVTCSYCNLELDADAEECPRCHNTVGMVEQTDEEERIERLEETVETLLDRLDVEPGG